MSRVSHALRTTAWAALAGALVAGCGGSGSYPVTGRLVYEDNGQPVTELAGFEVTFTSEELGKSSSGEVQPDGTFRLTTTKPDDGAFPGTYKVILSQPHPNPERSETRHPAVDLMYEDPASTPLEETVEPKANEFTFKLKRFVVRH